jgi:hypothetical protein
MSEHETKKISATEVDFNNFDFDSLPVELFENYKKSAKAKALDKMTNLRKQLLAEETLHLITDADFIDSYGKTVAAIAADREKEGVTLAELMTVMQEDYLRRAIKNLGDNGIVKVVKLHPDGKDSGNKKYLYLPEFTPVRK